ncbi:hypothetical protein SLS62_003638 [Diatrype stigma]|uniref:Amidoligase enzyme n=1 Tax=Diatrype stigma TaxID=117547 RepID=A0AAN9UY13_9PEZI
MPLHRSRYPLQRDLTFGIEFEFFVHENVLPSGADERDEQILDSSSPIPINWSTDAAYHIKRILDRLNLHKRVVVAGYLQRPPRRLTQDERNFSAWVITTDVTLQPDNGNYRPWIGLEVKSPILRNRTEICREVQRVSETLLQDAYVGFNPKCGLHVHVGRGQDGIPLAACQRLFSLLFLYAERILDPLFRSDRRGNIHCENLETHALVRRLPQWRFRMTGTPPEQWLNACFPGGAPGVGAPGDERERFVALRKIWSAGDINEFCDMNVVGGVRLAVNFAGLKVRPHPGPDDKPTIEFRKAEGDLNQEGNIDFLLYWPQVCMGLVAFALGDGLDEFARVMREAHAALNAPDEAEKLRRFLNSMGFDRTVVEMLCERADYLSRDPYPDAPTAQIVEPPLSLDLLF